MDDRVVEASLTNLDKRLRALGMKLIVQNVEHSTDVRAYSERHEFVIKAVGVSTVEGESITKDAFDEAMKGV